MEKKFFIVVLLIAACIFGSCTKNNKGNATLSLRMTDDPANYDAVNIDLESAEITGENGGIINLNVNAGIYNLLDFTNGNDTLIAIGIFEAQTIEQIRLILGDNNSVVVDGVTYPLSTPSAQQSGLKLQVHNTFEAGVAYELLLDFDAGQSIVEEGNGDYQLKPVIRVIQIAISGSILGSIIPAGINCVVTATGNGQIFSTFCDAEGNFLLQGIPSGTYHVTLTPDLPFSQVTLNDVIVVTGQATNVGTIGL